MDRSKLPDLGNIELKLLPVQRQTLDEMKAWARSMADADREPLIIDATDLKVAVVTNRLELALLDQVLDATPGAPPRPPPPRSRYHGMAMARGLDLHKLMEAWLKLYPEARAHVQYARSLDLKHRDARRAGGFEVDYSPLEIRAMQRIADFGAPGGMRAPDPVGPPKPQPQPFKKGTFFPPETVAKGRRFNKPQRKFR